MKHMDSPWIQWNLTLVRLLFITKSCVDQICSNCGILNANYISPIEHMESPPKRNALKIFYLQYNIIKHDFDAWTMT